MLSVFILNACDSENATTVKEAFEADCKRLGDGDEYHAVYGKVIDYRIISPPGDCFSNNHECPPEQSSASAGMRPLLETRDETGTEFRAHIKQEDAHALSQKPPYFEIGESYGFCAKGPDKKTIKGNPYYGYQIDDVSTIVKLAGVGNENLNFHSKTLGESDLSLEEKCSELSETDGHDYEVISGFVLRAYKSLSEGECFEDISCQEYYENQPSEFYAYMSPIGLSKQGQQLRINTKPEPTAELRKKEPYMQERKWYAFCAYKHEVSRPNAPSEIWYQINSVDTIEEMEEIEVK